MAKKPIKETIHAKGFDIGIYTTDFENEYISLTDIARYKSDEISFHEAAKYLVCTANGLDPEKHEIEVND